MTALVIEINKVIFSNPIVPFSASSGLAPSLDCCAPSDSCCEQEQCCDQGDCGNKEPEDCCKKEKEDCCDKEKCCDEKKCG